MKLIKKAPGVFCAFGSKLSGGNVGGEMYDYLWLYLFKVSTSELTIVNLISVS